MDEKGTFGFRQDMPRLGGLPLCKDLEEFYLMQLDDPSADKQDARLQLMMFYRSSARAADAMFYAEQYISHATAVEEKITAFYVLGQAMEHVKDWESAIKFYLQGFNLEPQQQFYQYFFWNNIGFSMNQLGRFVEAEKYLRDAIPIDRTRCNAFKNLGLSLEGQGRFVEAVESYVAAVRADAADRRALRHLEEMVSAHHELFEEIPDLNQQIEKCRSAVKIVKNMNERQVPPSRN